MKTSIVMATYNGATYIMDQMECLIRQTSPPDELIIADDGSTDLTRSIIQTLLPRIPFPVRLINRNENLGYAINFSDAALHAEHDIIFFCDQDDYWHPGKIEAVRNWFINNPDKSLVTHNIAICNEHLKVEIDDYFMHLDKNNSRHTFIKGCATAVRRNLIREAFPVPRASKWAHDARVHALARIKGSDGELNSVLVKHRIHKTQTSGLIISGENISLGGRLLRKLDFLAYSKLSNPAKLLFLFSELASDPSIHEFLKASNRTDLYDQMIGINFEMKERNNALSFNSRISSAASICSLYASGGYSNIGKLYRLSSDVMRILKGNPNQIREYLP